MIDAERQPYWQYEAKGGIGDFSGALAGIVSIYDNENTAVQASKFGPGELQNLAKLARTFDGLITCRSSPTASRRVGNTLKPNSGTGTVTPIRFSGTIRKVFPSWTRCSPPLTHDSRCHGYTLTVGASPAQVALA